MSGVVRSIGEGILGTPFISFRSAGVFSVQALFDESSLEQLAALRINNFVRVRCRCNGKLGNVILRDCSLLTGLR